MELQDTRRSLTDDEHQWGLGVIFCVTGCILGSVGMMLIKWSHLQAQADRDAWLVDVRRSAPLAYWEHRVWWLGTGLLLLGVVPLDMMALSLLPLVTFMPITGVTLVLNAVVVPWLLIKFSQWQGDGATTTKPKLPKSQMAGSMCVLVGVTLAVAFGSHSYQDMDARRTGDLLQKSGSLAYMIVGWLIIMVLMYIANSGSYGQWVDKCWILALVSHALLTGFVGSQHLIFLKGFVDAIRTWLRNQSFDDSLDAWTDWRTYIYLLLALLISLLQLNYLNQGLEIFDAGLYLPVYNMMLMMFGMAGGFVIFEEAMDGSDTGYYLLGIGIVVVGMLMLTQDGRSDPPPSETEQALQSVHQQTVGEEECTPYGSIAVSDVAPPSPTLLYKQVDQTHTSTSPIL
eukprot:TRINITY_DN2976_c0_g1_i3.p1 TRINITY_DN2976_c0_g1~~TRINITY_DN2976_c0_g1_i3.p1  ORF type:complete len:399 (+),score=77.84 TRINITY_DN2976_c0_g1_i3:220-1416(+)